MTNKHTGILPVSTWWWIVIGEWPYLTYAQVARDRDGELWLSKHLAERLDDTFAAHRYSRWLNTPNSSIGRFGPITRHVDSPLAHGQTFRQLLLPASELRKEGNDSVVELVDALDKPHALPDQSVREQMHAIPVEIDLPPREVRSTGWPKVTAMARITYWLLTDHRPLSCDAIKQEFGIADRTWRNWRKTLNEIPELDLAFTHTHIYLVPRHGFPPEDEAAAYQNQTEGMTRRHSYLDKEEVRRLYCDEKMSIKAVSERVDCSPRTLREFMEESGIEPRDLSSAALLRWHGTD